MAGKEGESYLDQLLNNASTSSQEAGVEQAKENARKAELDNVGLQEALAVLNDLPDETGIPAKADPKEELEDLKNLYEEFGNEVIPEEAPQSEPEPEEVETEPEVKYEENLMPNKTYLPSDNKYFVMHQNSHPQFEASLYPSSKSEQSLLNEFHENGCSQI